VHCFLFAPRSILGANMKDWLKISAILALDLQFLPKTKVGLAAKAKREGWETLEESGNGGVTKFYKIPTQYLTGGAAPTHQKLTLYAAQQAAAQAFKMAQIVGGVDVEKFVEMFTTLCKTEQEPQPSMSPNAIRAQAKVGKGKTAFNIGSQTAGGEISNIKTIKGDLNK
jgi:hypothetical protein